MPFFAFSSPTRMKANLIQCIVGCSCLCINQMMLFLSFIITFESPLSKKYITVLSPTELFYLCSFLHFLPATRRNANRIQWIVEYNCLCNNQIMLILSFIIIFESPSTIKFMTVLSPT